MPFIESLNIYKLQLIKSNSHKQKNPSTGNKRVVVAGITLSSKLIPKDAFFLPLPLPKIPPSVSFPFRAPRFCLMWKTLKTKVRVYLGFLLWGLIGHLGLLSSRVQAKWGWLLVNLLALVSGISKMKVEGLAFLMNMWISSFLCCSMHYRVQEIIGNWFCMLSVIRLVEIRVQGISVEQFWLNRTELNASLFV